MLAELLVTPNTPEEWSVWSFHHRDNHTVIRQAIQAQKNVALPEYNLDPIPHDIELWAESNQRAHNDMNGALGLQGSDLGALDIKNQSALAAWIYSHYQEHQTASLALHV